MAIWLRWGVRKKYEHQPHAKRPQRAPLQSHIKANRKTLQSGRRPWLGRLPDAWCWRRRSVRTGQWQLPSRRANQGGYGCRPLHQCVGKESSRHSLKLFDYRSKMFLLYAFDYQIAYRPRTHLRVIFVNRATNSSGSNMASHRVHRLLAALEILPPLAFGTNKMRNDWTGHGGVVGQQDARLRNELLLSEILRVRELLGDVWTNTQLITHCIAGRSEASSKTRSPS
jgi:hypothetical protein